MDYIMGQTLYTGSETRVVRATHPKSGSAVVLKIPREDPPSLPILQRLRHEYAYCARSTYQESFGRSAWSLTARASRSCSSHGGTVARSAAYRPAAGRGRAAPRAKVARALGEVHRRGILHRDIKPQNILVDPSGANLPDRLRARDRREQAVEADVAVEALAGTLAYMAPEQTGRMNRAVDARADLYALGATLYQMLTGALPFETTDALELIHAHIARAPVPPHERAPEQSIPEAGERDRAQADGQEPRGSLPDRRRRGLGSGAGGAGVGRDGDGGAVPAGEARLGRSGPHALAPVRSGARERRARGAVRRGVRRRGGAFAGGGAVGRGQVGAGAGAARARCGRAGASSPPASSTSSSAARRTRRWRRRCGRWCGGGSADPAEVLERWKQAWQEAAGPNGQILVELMPELVHILGEPQAAGRARADGGQAPLPDDGAALRADAWPRPSTRWCCSSTTCSGRIRRRFRSWASCMTEPAGRHLLVVGAYRDEEVGPEHPLNAAGCLAREPRAP